MVLFRKILAKTLCLCTFLAEALLFHLALFQRYGSYHSLIYQESTTINKNYMHQKIVAKLHFVFFLKQQQQQQQQQRRILQKSTNLHNISPFGPHLPVLSGQDSPPQWDVPRDREADVWTSVLRDHASSQHNGIN